MQQLQHVIQSNSDRARSGIEEHDELGQLLSELVQVPMEQRMQAFWPRTIENVRRFLIARQDESVPLAMKSNPRALKEKVRRSKSGSQNTLKIQDSESSDDDDDADSDEEAEGDPFGTLDSDERKSPTSPNSQYLESLAGKISMNISTKKKEEASGEIEDQRAAKDQARTATFSVRASKSPLRNSKENGFAGNSLAQMKQRMQQLREAREKQTELTFVQIRHTPPQPKRQSKSPRPSSKSPPSAVASSPFLKEIGAKPQTSNRSLFDSLLGGNMRITGDPETAPSTSRSQSHSLLLKLGQRQHSLSSPSLQTSSSSTTTLTPTTTTTTTTTTSSSSSSASSPSIITPSAITSHNPRSLSPSPSPSLMPPTSPSLSTSTTPGQINIQQYVVSAFRPNTPKRTKRGSSQITQPHSTPLPHDLKSTTLSIDDIESPEIPPSSIQSPSVDQSTPTRVFSPTQRDPAFFTSSPLIQPQMPFRFMALSNQYPTSPSVLQRTGTGAPFGALPLPTGPVLPVPIQTPSLFSGQDPPQQPYPPQPTYPYHQ